jgi:hypothetical protein
MSDWDYPTSGGSPDGGSSTLMMGGSSLMCVCSLIACILGFVLWWIYDKASFCKVIPFCGSETNPPNTNTIPHTGTDTTLPANNPPAPPAGGGDWKCIQSSSDGGNWVKTKNANGKVLCAGPDANNCFWSPTEAECQGKPSNDGLVCTQTAAGWCKDAAAGTSSGGGGAPAPPAGGGGGKCDNSKLPALRNRGGGELHLMYDLTTSNDCNKIEIKDGYLKRKDNDQCLDRNLNWQTCTGETTWETWGKAGVDGVPNGVWAQIAWQGRCLESTGLGSKVTLRPCEEGNTKQHWWQMRP